jgi:hypothetical protein
MPALLEGQTDGGAFIGCRSVVKCDPKPPLVTLQTDLRRVNFFA